MTSPIRYETWKSDHVSFLESFSGKTVILTFSGGKDSSAGLHLMQRASSEFDFDLDVHAVLFPHHVYTYAEVEVMEKYWEQRGIRIRWHKGESADRELERAVQEGIDPCSVCNRAKKTILIREGRSLFADPESIVLTMSYSLWDLVSATMEHILGTRYSAAPGPVDPGAGKADRRFLETSQRFYPLIRLKDGLQVFKPLIRYNDQQIIDLIERVGTPLCTTLCQYCHYRPKRVFAQYYERADLRFDFDRVFTFARDALQIPDLSHYETLDMALYFNRLI